MSTSAMDTAGVGPMPLGSRVFSRTMSWVCRALAAAMIVVAVGMMAPAIIVGSSGLMSCDKAAAAPRIPGVAVSCHTTTTYSTITKTVRTPDGHVSRTVLTGPPPPAPHGSPAGLAMFLGSAPPLLLALALWRASRFFATVADGGAFQAVAVRRLRDFCILGVGFLLCDALLEPLINAVLGLFGGYSIHVSWPYSSFGLPGAPTWELSGSALMDVVFA